MVDRITENARGATPRKNPVGNVLGGARAESDDAMLAQAFLETADYRALTETQDFNFVVGRRGTGKSALFHKVGDYYSKDPRTFLVRELPSEHQTLYLQSRLEEFGSDYRLARAIMRLVWRAVLLFHAAQALNRHYKISRSSQRATLREYEQRYGGLLNLSGTLRCSEILKCCHKPGTPTHNIPNEIAGSFQIERLQQSVAQAFQDTKRQMVVLFDGLDEGWVPTPVATAILGGLAQALTDVVDSKTGIHGIAFVRDNMFRALAHFDGDFSRNVEGSSLRLQWREDSLLALVAKRLRVAFQLGGIENDARVWNRFAQNELKDRKGFESCLRLTLYRPRDILVLLNRAYADAARADRQAIIGSDVEASAKAISKERLADLIKEYDRVFPGLGLFVRAFEGRRAVAKMSEVLRMLDEYGSNNDFREEGSEDFALFSSGRDILAALYSVGFIGFREARGGGGYVFCHDGSSSEIDPSQPDLETVIHPCYWGSLNLKSDNPDEELIVQLEDDDKNSNRKGVQDQRTKLLGQIVSQLPSLPIGDTGSREFEEWVMRTAKILFAGKLCNFEWKPNPGAIQQRDIVATNMAEAGVWRRILDDYETRQVIFEVKNYATLKPEDFRQVSSYLTGEYGRLAVVVTRSPSEGLDGVERGWVKEIWTSQKHLILLIPAKEMSHWASKLRSDKKYDYVEEHVGRRIDTFVRSYLSLKHEKSYRGRR